MNTDEKQTDRYTLGVKPLPPSFLRKVVDRFVFSEAWLVVASVVLLFIMWPIRNIALVCWVCGTDAYFDKGIRVLPGKPTKFSNGELVPDLPNFVTGMAAFLITIGLIIVSIQILFRLDIRRPKPRRDPGELARDK